MVIRWNRAIVFGVLIAVKGVIALLDAVKAKNVANILVAVVTVAVGVMLIISKWVMLDWFFIALGVIFIINGALALFGKKLVK